VEEGGIHVMCQECGMRGALPADHQASKAVRKQMNIPTGPCGLEFTSCEEHSDAASAKSDPSSSGSDPPP
jgi:hypothetical protein